MFIREQSANQWAAVRASVSPLNGISLGMCLSNTEMSFVNRNSSSVGETS